MNSLNEEKHCNSKFWNDPQVININLFNFGFNRGRKNIQCISSSSIEIFLNHHCSIGVDREFPKKTNCIFKNDTDSSILNLTIVSRETGNRVFFTKEISARKTLQFAFLRKGVFDIHFWFPFVDLPIKGTIKVVGSSFTQPRPKNFKFDLRPFWH